MSAARPLIVLDAAMTLDGFWADGDDHSVYPIAEMHAEGLVEPLAKRTGAVVMSGRSFEMAEDPDWYADHYELQRPIFVFTDKSSARHPKENAELKFVFVPDFATAIQQAITAAGKRDVMVIGEASAAQSALDSGLVDEFYLRIEPRLIGDGALLLRAGLATQKFSIRVAKKTAHTVYLHLVRA